MPHTLFRLTRAVESVRRLLLNDAFRFLFTFVVYSGAATQWGANTFPVDPSFLRWCTSAPDTRFLWLPDATATGVKGFLPHA